MVYTVSITSQGQISIPIQLRRKLGLDKNRTALVTEEEGKIVVKPMKDFLELAGSLHAYVKGKKPLSNKELDEAVAKAVGEEYLEKLKRNQ